MRPVIPMLQLPGATGTAPGVTSAPTIAGTAQAGQTLTVRWSQASASGNISLAAATLALAA